MLTMNLALNIDAQRMIQQVQLNNKELEERVQAGLDQAIKELSEDGVIEKMICDAAKKNLLDTFTRFKWDYEIRAKLEKQITDKLSAKIGAYTDAIVEELAQRLDLPKD